MLKGEYCRTLTRDGLELQGFLATPEAGPAKTSVLHVHGLAGNFYEIRFIDQVAASVVRLGVNFLTVNTRGRDYISDFFWERPDGTTQYKQIGSIYEVFDDSVLDIEAWARFLTARQTEHIILQGHSHGALKVTYYIYRTQDPKVRGLILISPSDHFGCQRQRIGDSFDEALRVAEKMIAEGSGARLMPETYFHYPVSAATYVDIFNRDSHLKIFNLAGTDRDEFPELESIGVPVLALVGSVDEAFIGTPQDYLAGLRARMPGATDFDGHVIEGAPHSFLHFEHQLAKRIEGWLGVQIEQHLTNR
jgi:pimeloyl-ACP methyl ester carboxylesterase